MKNKLLVFTLFICTVVCAVIADYVYTDEVRERRETEYRRYAELGANPHGLYGGYTVEQIAEGYTAASSNAFGKTVINAPVVNQFPDLPVGCEIASAASLLQYLGFNIDHITLARDFVHADDNFTFDDQGESWGPDPRKVFAGDPFGWGYGCYAPVIKDMANNYFAHVDSEYKAAAIYGLNPVDMEKLVDKGVPVVVWASREMKPFNYREAGEWYINGTGEAFEWAGNSHALLLCGYDATLYYFMDPDDKTEIVPYSKEVFLRRFDEAGKQAVVVLRHGATPINN